MYKKSFLKWAGGKYKLLDKIIPELNNYEVFIEPFAGSGVIWLNSNNRMRIVNDINIDLINLYKELDESFIQELKPYFIPENNNEDKYYELRDKFNNSTNSRERSLIFIYINRHCYNGLCRYNKKGGFNVPFGNQRTIHFPEHEMRNIINCKTTKIIKFFSQDYRKFFNNDFRTSVIYCDPPYDTFDDLGFTDYSNSEFGKKEQKELAELCMASKHRVIISNHDTEYVRELYKGCSFMELDVQRNISRGKREKAKEVLIIKEEQGVTRKAFANIFDELS